MLALRPAWHFDRVDRLEAAIGRARRLEEYLRRSACDTPRHSLARERYAARLAVIQARVARLCRCARAERCAARLSV